MTDKVTTMILHADFHCSCCYKKIKKILCKFPEIRDQVYDKKQNTMTIIVICCSPEKIRDKLCCKGRKSITSIEIKEPEKKKDKPNDVKEQTPVNKPKTNGKPAKIVDDGPPKQAPQTPKQTPPPSPPDPVNAYIPTQVCCGPCSEGIPGGPCYHGFGRTPPPPSGDPVNAYIPTQVCCEPCSEGIPGGPCYHGFGRTPPPSPQPPPSGDPVNTYIPIQVCCEPCSEGISGGPCYHGFGRTPPPPDPVNTYIPIQVCCGPCSEGIFGGPCYHRFGRTTPTTPPPPPPPCYYPPRKPCYCYGRRCYMTGCDCNTVGNPSACTIM